MKKFSVIGSAVVSGITTALTFSLDEYTKPLSRNNSTYHLLVATITSVTSIVFGYRLKKYVILGKILGLCNSVEVCQQKFGPISVETHHSNACSNRCFWIWGTKEIC